MKLNVGLSFLLILLMGLLTACQTTGSATKQTSLEMQAYQSQVFEAEKRATFNATLSVLQDAGYIIEAADMDTGFMTGKAPTQHKVDFWFGPMNTSAKVSAFIAEESEGKTKVRLNFVESSQRKSAWNYTQDVVQDTPVRDPEVYRNMFTRIGDTLFILKSK